MQHLGPPRRLRGVVLKDTHNRAVADAQLARDRARRRALGVLEQHLRNLNPINARHALADDPQLTRFACRRPSPGVVRFELAVSGLGISSLRPGAGRDDGLDLLSSGQGFRGG